MESKNIQYIAIGIIAILFLLFALYYVFVNPGPLKTLT